MAKGKAPCWKAVTPAREWPQAARESLPRRYSARAADRQASFSRRAAASAAIADFLRAVSLGALLRAGCFFDLSEVAPRRPYRHNGLKIRILGGYR